MVTHFVAEQPSRKKEKSGKRRIQREGEIENSFGYLGPKSCKSLLEQMVRMVCVTLERKRVGGEVQQHRPVVCIRERRGEANLYVRSRKAVMIRV